MADPAGLGLGTTRQPDALASPVAEVSIALEAAGEDFAAGGELAALDEPEDELQQAAAISAAVAIPVCASHRLFMTGPVQVKTLN